MEINKERTNKGQGRKNLGLMSGNENGMERSDKEKKKKNEEKITIIC